MKDFETFKASREKIDPAARKMSDHQWQQAYDAYKRTRSRRKGSSGSSRGLGTSSSNGSSVSNEGLRDLVRERSAYSQLRFIVEVFFWVAIVLVVLIGATNVLRSFDPLASLLSLLMLGLHLLVVVLLRLLIHALVDIPDIALYRMTPPIPDSKSKDEEPAE